jgi:hypothetical protein
MFPAHTIWRAALSHCSLVTKPLFDIAKLSYISQGTFCCSWPHFPRPSVGLALRRPLFAKYLFPHPLLQAQYLHTNMGKRHNRKRTRSRPRHRDGQSQPKIHTRSDSIDTTSSQASMSSYHPTSPYHPIANSSAMHWDETYFAWQNRLQIEQQRQQLMEKERIRYFGGVPGEEVSLLEPMLQVVMDLFDGNTDFEYS